MKYIYVFLIAIFIHVLTGNCFGQNIVLKGRVIDSETSNSLPYATIQIFNLKTGTIADEKGTFLLSVSSHDLKRDTVEFSYLGYFKSKMSIADFTKSDDPVIRLKENAIGLSEIVVLPKNYKIKKLGITEKKQQRNEVVSTISGNLGNYIENEKGQTGWVKSVSFYIGDEGHPEAPFRVRIYDLDKEKKWPGQDLLQENLIVSASKAGWFTVELSKYNILFPADGIFVMMEWINSGDRYYYDKEITIHGKNGESDKKEIRKFYGQTLGSVMRQSNLITWGKGLGNDWIPYQFFYKGYLNTMINADIAFSIE